MDWVPATLALLLVLAVLAIAVRRGAQGRRVEQRRHRRILQAVGDGVLEFDARGRLVFMNLAAQRLLGWDDAEVRDRAGLHRLVHSGAGCELATCPVVTARPPRHGSPGTPLAPDGFRRPGGEQVPVEWTVTSTDDGDPPATTLVVHDRSERRRREEAQALADRMRTEHSEAQARLEAARREGQDARARAQSLEREAVALRAAAAVASQSSSLLDALWRLELQREQRHWELAGWPPPPPSVPASSSPAMSRSGAEGLAAPAPEPSSPDMGLENAIHQELSRLREETGTPGELVSQIETPLPCQVALVVFRIVQEALAAFARSSEEVGVELRTEDGWFQVSVACDDPALAARLAEPQGAEGPSTTRRLLEQAAGELGGELDVVSAPEVGVALVLRVPLAG